MPQSALASNPVLQLVEAEIEKERGRPNHWHPSLGCKLPPLPGTGTQMMMSGKVGATGLAAKKHFRDRRKRTFSWVNMRKNDIDDWNDLNK